MNQAKGNPFSLPHKATGPTRQSGVPKEQDLDFSRSESLHEGQPSNIQPNVRVVHREHVIGSNEVAEPPRDGELMPGPSNGRNVAPSPTSSRSATIKATQGASLKFTLANAHRQWELVREATLQIRRSNNDRQWRPNSVFHKTLTGLENFEKKLDKRYDGTRDNLVLWEQRGLKNDFANVRMEIELCHVVLRKALFSNMLKDKKERDQKQRLEYEKRRKRMASDDEEVVEEVTRKRKPRGPTEGFWAKMAHCLFFHASLLQEWVSIIQEAHVRDGRPYPQMFPFSLYQCCSLGTYLWRHPYFNAVLVSTPEIKRPDVSVDDYRRLSPQEQGVSMRTQHSFEILHYISSGSLVKWVHDAVQDHRFLWRMVHARSDYDRGKTIGGMIPWRFWIDLLTAISWDGKDRHDLFLMGVYVYEESLVDRVFDFEMEVERSGKFAHCLFGTGEAFQGGH